MLYKYLKLLLLSAVLLQASPKLFNGYGNQIEAFKKDCQNYRKLSLLPKDIKKKCKLYDSKVNRAFKYGHKLDSYVDSDNVNLDKSEKYNSYLHELEENRDYILSLIRKEIYKARKQENIKYYSQLITSNEIVLWDSDYSFMKKHEDKFNKHPKYIAFERNMYLQETKSLKKEIEHIRSEKEKNSVENKQEIIALKKEREKLRGDVIHLYKLVTKAKKNLKNCYNNQDDFDKKRVDESQQTKSTNCNQAMIYASSSAENAEDYALKGNHKYALIEVKEAIAGTKLALESCKEKVDAIKMDELSKNLSSLSETRKKIENKLSKNLSSKTIYTITKDDNMRDINGDYVKRSVEVSLSKKVSPDKLKQIAYAIKQIDKISYKRTFIGYYLPDTDKQQGYWATTHFNPKLEVLILGLTIEEEKTLTQRSPSEEGVKLIGSWMDNRPYIGWKYTLLYKNETLLLRVTYKSGGSNDEKMVKSDYRGMQKFNYKDREAFGEYFVINSSNELEFRNSEHKTYYRAKPLE